MLQAYTKGENKDSCPSYITSFVVSSASLQYQDFQGSKKCHIDKYWRIDSCGLRKDPCGTPYSMSLQELKVSFNFTLCFLFDR